MSVMHDIAREIMLWTDHCGGAAPKVWGIEQEQLRPLAEELLKLNEGGYLRTPIEGGMLLSKVETVEQMEFEILAGRAVICAVPIRVWARP